MTEACLTSSLLESIRKDFQDDIHDIFCLSDFYISPQFVCHREPDWGEWSVCFLKLISLYQSPCDMPFLIQKITQLNLLSPSPYGIYNFNEIIKAAALTAYLPEGSTKKKSFVKNYLNEELEEIVIFDDNALANFIHYPLNNLFTRGFDLDSKIFKNG